MPALQYDNIGDIINATTKRLNKGKIVDISLTLQEYPFVMELMKNKKETVPGGYGYEFTVLTTTSGAGEDAGLLHTDTHALADGTIKGYVPYRGFTSNWIWDEGIIDINTGEERILEYVKLQEQMCLNDWCEKMESRGWTAP